MKSSEFWLSRTRNISLSLRATARCNKIYRIYTHLLYVWLWIDVYACIYMSIKSYITLDSKAQGNRCFYVITMTAPVVASFIGLRFTTFTKWYLTTNSPQMILDNFLWFNTEHIGSSWQRLISSRTSQGVVHITANQLGIRYIYSNKFWPGIAGKIYLDIDNIIGKT